MLVFGVYVNRSCTVEHSRKQRLSKVWEQDQQQQQQLCFCSTCPCQVHPAQGVGKETEVHVLG